VAKVVFLDTVPYMFLFCKYLPIGKSLGEIFENYGYGFFVTDSCWKDEHLGKWKKLEVYCPDFKYMDRLTYMVRQHLRAALETQLTDEIDECLEGNLQERFKETVKEIRSASVFGEIRPSDEETEIILLATLVEKCKTINYDCRTMVLFGDDIHSQKLAEVFDKTIRIPAGARFLYSRDKCFTMIDFLSSQSAKDILPKNYIDLLLSNYAKLKLSEGDYREIARFLDRCLQELPIIQDSVIFLDQLQFRCDFELFCSNIRRAMENSLIKLTKAHYLSIVEKNPRILSKAKETIPTELKKECHRLIKDFSRKYTRFMPRRTANRNRQAIDNLTQQICEKANLASKNVTMG